MNYNDPYLAYYRQQTGHGVSSVFRGASYQRGHGIGSFLSGLVRTVTPLIKSGATAFSKEALRSGVGFLGDIAAGTVNPKHAAGERLKQFTGSLKRRADNKMERVLSGGGYKRRRRVTSQSLTRLLRQRSSRKRVGKKKRRVKKRAVKTTRRKNNKVVDIFK